LVHLRKSIIAPIGQSHILNLVLPLVNIEEDIPIQDSPDLQLEGCTYVLHDVQNALRHSCYLLALIVDVSSSSASKSSTTPAIRGHLAWILDSFLFLREVESTWGPHCATQQSEFQLCFVSIRAVNSLLTSSNLLSTALKRKAYSALTYLCAELVSYSGALSDTALQTAFCSSLLELAAASVQYEAVFQVVEAVLLPALQTFLNNELASGLLTTDVQVCLLLPRLHALETLIIN
jgi:serine/threonine-protein kinase ATR